MSAEWISALASVLSLFVIALGAVAGLRQIAHIRTANQSSALLAFSGRFNEPEVRAAATFVREGGLLRVVDDFGDSDDLAALHRAGLPAVPVFYFWEALGCAVVFGMLDPTIAFGVFDPLMEWNAAEPFIRAYRRLAGRETVLDKFEAMAALYADHVERPLPKVTPEIAARLRRGT